MTEIENKNDEPKEQVIEQEENKKEPKAVAKRQNDITIDKMGKMVPKTAEEQFRIAAMLYKAGVVPKNHKSPSETMAIMQFGASLGMTMFETMRGVAMVNGSPSLHTDAPLNLVLRSKTVKRKVEYFFDKDGNELDETKANSNNIYGAYCEMERKGIDGACKGVYTIDEAKAAGLMKNPEKPWNKHRKVMLKRRARSFVLKDLWADILGGQPIAEYDFDALPEHGDYGEGNRLVNLNEKYKNLEGDQPDV